MRRIIQFLYTLIFILFCIYWVHRGHWLGKKEWEEEKLKEIKGKIIRIEMPEGHKVIILYLSDSTTYRPYTNMLNDVANIGDSIYKSKNSYRLILFKNGNQNDTLSFVEKSNDVGWW